jgi:predicted acyltransferase
MPNYAWLFSVVVVHQTDQEDSQIYLHNTSICLLGYNVTLFYTVMKNTTWKFFPLKVLHIFRALRHISMSQIKCTYR